MALAPEASTSTFTKTNLQESGVDEADRFKSDGHHFFILGRASNEATDFLQIRRLTGITPSQSAAGNGSTFLTKLALPSGSTYTQAYLANERPGTLPDVLLAIGESGQNYYTPAVGVGTPALLARDWFVPWQWQNGKIELQWIDVSNPAIPHLGRRIGIDGYHVASRRIGETLYLVSRYTPRIPEVVPYTLNNLLPKWSIDGVEQGPMVGANTCYQPSGSSVETTADLIVVSAINLANPQAAPQSQCLTGASEAVYVSTEALYIATARQIYTLNQTTIARYPAEATTDIHKFSLTDAAPRYRGSGSVIGHLGWEQNKKPFRMGEYQGVLRVVTSLGQDWDSTASTRLTLLREAEGKLSTLSTLPNSQRLAALGKPGERLYAARFMGNRAYLVTFRVTDPLYVLDLSVPADPKLAGELTIPGYSDYLHPLGERWLIGVGKDAVADTTAGDGRGAWYQGVKVALFDVADPTHPKEVNSIVIGKRGSHSAVTFEHHAFTLLPTGNETGELARLALPIARHAGQASSGTDSSDPRTWYDWSDTGLHLFNVTDQGLTPHGVIVAESSVTTSYPVIDTYDDRAFLNNQEAHYLHGQNMWATAW
jgi:hypothetical protein